MKRTYWLVPFMVVSVLFFGCSDDNEEAIWLATVSNPFLGQWQSDIPSAGTTLTFNYKTDGTFDYEMAGVPAEQGGKGTGGYVVYGNKQISYLEFEGAALYIFEVIDNNTINVTELEPDETGELVPGNTAPFTRVPGSPVNRENKPLNLNNAFLGTWLSDIPSAGTTLTFNYKTGGTFDYEMAGVPAEQGGTGCYIVYEDTQVSYLEFEIIDDDTITVTELEKNEDGNTALFTRVTN
ncbi:MAG: hypothetical protein LBK43_05375 [Treponema sp.]|jgi:hypothetical protein|nr:hypothetical protein [Treponema sp.]